MVDSFASHFWMLDSTEIYFYQNESLGITTSGSTSIALTLKGYARAADDKLTFVIGDYPMHNT